MTKPLTDKEIDYRIVEHDGETCLYLTAYNVRVATFSNGLGMDAEKIIQGLKEAKAYNTVKAELEWKEFKPRDEKTYPGKEGYYDVWIEQQPNLLKRFPHLPKAYPKALWWLAKEGRFFEACPGMTHYRGPITPPTIRGEG